MKYGFDYEDHNTRLRNELRQGFMNPVRSSLHLGPQYGGGSNGPPGGYNNKRTLHRELNPDMYASLPPISNRYHRNHPNLKPQHQINTDLERIRPKYDEGPQDMSDLARRQYYDRARNPIKLSAGQLAEKQKADWEAARAHQNYLRTLERTAKMPLASNMMRNPDLNIYERASLGLEATNVDQLRLMKNLPVGTDIYRYKLEQVKELGTMRGEVMKIVEEQRLREMKKKYELRVNLEDKNLENRLWSDDQMKNIIQRQIRQAMGKEYNLENGGNTNIEFESD